MTIGGWWRGKNGASVVLSNSKEKPVRPSSPRRLRPDPHAQQPARIEGGEPVRWRSSLSKGRESPDVADITLSLFRALANYITRSSGSRLKHLEEQQFQLSGLTEERASVGKIRNDMSFCSAAWGNWEAARCSPRG
jgi:hypothetical protein